MEKGQIVKCITSYKPWITKGKAYPIVAVKGDSIVTVSGSYKIKGDYGFALIDDDGDCIFSADLKCSYGVFEVVS